MNAGEAFPERGVRCRPVRTRMPGGGGWGLIPPATQLSPGPSRIMSWIAF